MAYSIVENTATSFIENRSIQLPRFQRKQTWGPADNFKLCISVFKGYPIGVVIINSMQNPECVDWLLDGRQRLNALTEMRNNPVSVYKWAQKFVSFKNGDDEQTLTDKFFSSIDDYLQNDFQKDKNKSENGENENDDDSEDEALSSFNFGQQYSSLKNLCDLLMIVHPILNKKSKLERMFMFNGIIPVQDLEYSEIKAGEYVLNVPQLWKFVKSCVNDLNDTKESFIAHLIRRNKLDTDTAGKLTKYVESHWEYYDKCFKTLVKFEQTLQASTIGVIKLTNASPLDAQNIFSLVNNGGTTLTAEELLSARPFWNIVVDNPSATLRDDAGKLYDKMGISTPNEVYRWDLCASLLLRIDRNNIVFDDLSSTLSPSDEKGFKKFLSLGFKTISAILVGGVNNTSVTKLERTQDFDWNVGIDNLVTDINMVINILEDYEYFKYIRSWNQSIMSLTSNTIAIEFIAVMYKRWKHYNCPSKSSPDARLLQKEAFILFDRLVYEYCIRIWSGSSDNKLASDLSNIEQRITRVSKEEWQALINELATTGEYKSKATKPDVVKPLIYHFYCMKKMMPTLLDHNTSYEIDHIVAKSLFNGATGNDDISIMKDCILNFALLPKGDNIAKSDQKLSVIKATDDWLTDQIVKYAGITRDDMDTLSDLNNVKKLCDIRLPQYLETFDSIRDHWLYN